MEFSPDSSSFFVTLALNLVESEAKSGRTLMLLAKVPYPEAAENQSGNVTLNEAAGYVAVNLTKAAVPNIASIGVEKVEWSRSSPQPAVINRRGPSFREGSVSFWDITVQ
jgi:hypothetical protein